PFLNLLRSPVHLPLRCLVRALLGLSTVVVGAFSNTHHRDLSRRAGKTVGGGVGQEQRGLRGTVRWWGQDGAMSDAAPFPNPAVCQLRVVLAGAL
ncbi:MAG: hypothetical protein WCF33_16275, partial [Pseudonocardiaceae bacterium]